MSAPSAIAVGPVQGAKSYAYVNMLESDRTPG